MTSKDILKPVQRYFYEKGNILQVAGYCGMGVFNPDIFIVTKSLLAIDIEIKVSRSDFKADFKKEIKHLYLKQGISKQAYFYYAVPHGLIRLDEVPRYAGLIYVNGNKVEVIKKAPRLHNKKLEPSDIISIANSLSAKCIFGESYMSTRNKEIRERNKFISLSST